MSARRDGLPASVAEELVVDDARAHFEPEVLALFTAFTTAQSLGFELAVHPGGLPGRLATVDRTTRAWLQPDRPRP